MTRPSSADVRPLSPEDDDSADSRATPIYALVRRAEFIGGTLAAVTGGIVVGAAILYLAGANPLDGYWTIISSSLGSSTGLTQMAIGLVPLLIIALGLAVAFEARAFNVGAEGQFMLGAAAGGVTAIFLDGVPGVLIIIASLLAGVIAGGAWGYLPGAMRAQLGANEVITSLLLNYVAIFGYEYLIRKPVRAEGSHYPQSETIPENSFLPSIPGTSVHIGLLIAIGLVPVTAYLLRHTRFGVRLTATGHGRDTAQAVGINTSRTITQSMTFSGATAGLAGAVQILGVQHMLQSSISSGFGFTAIIVALLGRNRPLGILVAGVFISALDVGGSALQVTQGIPTSAMATVMALFILFLLLTRRVGG